MKYIQKMPDADEMITTYSLTEKQKMMRDARIMEIKDILSGKDKRKIICIGPCSADREDAVLEYMNRLMKVQEAVKSKLLFIPRVYTSKPRTLGNGYKGMLHRPDPDAGSDNLIDGVIAVRKMHLHVIQETGFFCADEILYPDTFYYYADLLAYAAVGARSVEDQ